MSAEHHQLVLRLLNNAQLDALDSAIRAARGELIVDMLASGFTMPSFNEVADMTDLLHSIRREAARRDRRAP